jgi:hypothetical protein
MEKMGAPNIAELVRRVVQLENDSGAAPATGAK